MGKRVGHAIAGVSVWQQQILPSRLQSLPGCLYVTSQIAVPQPAEFVHINHELLQEFGLDLDPCIFNFLINTNETLSGLASLYAGHQFGVYTSKLGDGRVHTIGDVAAVDGRTWEVQLKGAGATAFARGNHGRMSLAEAITEYLGGEALAGLGISASRGIAIINHAGCSSGLPQESIYIRTAENHLRFGHFEYLHNQGDTGTLKALADHVIASCYPELADYDDVDRYLQFLFAVTRRTAELLAQWQSAGFVHGVMNTDNMSITGLTLDLGVYGFMESYDPCFSSNESDDQQRYAFNQQVDVARWNCLALAEALTGLLPNGQIPASLLRLYRASFHSAYVQQMRQKLGLLQAKDEDTQMVQQLMILLQRHRMDYTNFFRCLSYAPDNPAALIDEADTQWKNEFSRWHESYRQRLWLESLSDGEREAMMLATNPRYILRHHLLEDVIQHASNHQYQPLLDMARVLGSPCMEHEDMTHMAA